MAQKKSYKDQLMELYGQGQNAGTGAAQTGTAQTGTGQGSNAMLDLILSRQPFSYDPKTDPAAQAIRKQTAREAARTTQNTLGTYAGMTGGMPSTAAVSTAAQAGSYAAAQGADKIAELKQLAYQNYQTEGDNMNAMLALMQQQETDAYNREQAQKQWDYGVEQDEYQKKLALAELKAAYGDYSGLKELGVDMSKYTSGGSGGYSYTPRAADPAPKEDDKPVGLSAAAKNDLTMAAYDNGGYVPAAIWEQYAAQYGEQALIDAGFKKGMAQSGGGGSTKKNPTQPAKPGNNMLN